MLSSPCLITVLICCFFGQIPPLPRGPHLASVHRVPVCWALVASSSLSAHGGVWSDMLTLSPSQSPIHSQKPQRFKSQVHNCSLNQSANLVVSLLANTRPGSVYSTEMVVRGAFRVAEKDTFNYWHVVYIHFILGLVLLIPFVLFFMGIIVFLRFHWWRGHTGRNESRL